MISTGVNNLGPPPMIKRNIVTTQLEEFVGTLDEAVRLLQGHL